MIVFEVYETLKELPDDDLIKTGNILLDKENNKFVIICAEYCEDDYYTYYYMISLSEYESLDKNKQYEYSDFEYITYISYNELINDDYKLYGNITEKISYKQIWKF